MGNDNGMGDNRLARWTAVACSMRGMRARDPAVWQSLKRLIKLVPDCNTIAVKAESGALGSNFGIVLRDHSRRRMPLM